MSDTDLGQRFACGGEEELEEIINLYGKKLLRYATAILCDYQEAENVVQEVFLAAYRTRTSFDGENISAWLYKITYHRSLNKLKKPKLLFFSEIFNETTEMLYGDTDLSEETLTALRRLKPKDRALVYGRIIEEQTYEQLASLLGSSPVALRKQYERAKKQLARYLSDSYYGKERNHEYI